CCRLDVAKTGPPELPGKTAKSSRKVGETVGDSGYEATRPDRRIGKPQPLAARPSGNPSTKSSSPGPIACEAKSASDARWLAGMAALATSGGAWMLMAATSWAG